MPRQCQAGLLLVCFPHVEQLIYFWKKEFIPLSTGLWVTTSKQPEISSLQDIPPRSSLFFPSLSLLFISTANIIAYVLLWSPLRGTSKWKSALFYLHQPHFSTENVEGTVESYSRDCPVPPLTISPTFVTRTPNFNCAHVNTQYDDYISQPQKFSALDSDHVCLSMSVSHLKNCVSLALLYPPLFLRHKYGTRSFYCLEPWEGRRGAGGWQRQHSYFPWQSLSVA